jgi:sulfite oxidase
MQTICYLCLFTLLLFIGKSWFEAKLDEQDTVLEPRHYGWTIWSASLKIPDDVDDVEIWSKAVDSSYNVQPESFENIWNLRGLLSNAYFKLKVGIHHSD